MLGANGAGKSTFLRAIAGQTRVDRGGTVLMDGKDITHRPPHEIVEAGIALVPEDRGIFADLTVQENLVLGAHPSGRAPREKENMARILSLFPRLGERRRQLVRTMSGGERQMVAIGRAMMSAPSILMLDEPSLGLSPLLCSELFRSLATSRTPASASFWWSRTPSTAWRSPTAAICSTTAISSARTPPRPCRTTRRSNAYLGGGCGVSLTSAFSADDVDCRGRCGT